MKRVQLFQYLIFSFFILSSCASHKGIMLESKCKGDCSYSAIAYGSAEELYILGIGGNASDALLFEARRNMNISYPLEKGAFYDNVIIDTKISRYVLFSKLKVTITADIVLSGKYAEDDVFTENYKHSLASGKQTTSNHLLLSDSVVFLSGSGIKKGVITAFHKKNAQILLSNQHERQVEIAVPVKNVYAIDNEEIEDTTGLEAGQIIEYVTDSKGKGATIVKEVVGMRPDKVLIRISRNGVSSYSIVPVELLKYK